jgi:hypothetical protein
MQLLLATASIILVYCSYAQTLHPEISTLMGKPELNQDYRSTLNQKTWMHQPEPGMILLRKASHTITTDTIKPNISSPLIHSYQINVHKISKDSARIVLNNPVPIKQSTRCLPPVAGQYALRGAATTIS